MLLRLFFKLEHRQMCKTMKAGHRYMRLRNGTLSTPLKPSSGPERRQMYETTKAGPSERWIYNLRHPRLSHCSKLGLKAIATGGDVLSRAPLIAPAFMCLQGRMESLSTESTRTFCTSIAASGAKLITF